MEFLRGYAAFLDYRYWLNPRPVPLGPSLVGAILTFFVWFLILSLVLKLIARSLRQGDRLRARILERFARLLSTTGLLGLLFLFFSYEQVPLLGMRLWFLLLLISFFVWLAVIVKYVVKTYPAERDRQTEKRRLERYLPGRQKTRT